jgi:hypothetical protein
MARILVDEVTRQPIKKGDTRTTFLGETVTVTSWQAPKNEVSTGRVNVTFQNGGTGHYYPSVIFAVFTPEESSAS